MLKNDYVVESIKTRDLIVFDAFLAYAPTPNDPSISFYPAPDILRGAWLFRICEIEGSAPIYDWVCFEVEENKAWEKDEKA